MDKLVGWLDEQCLENSPQSYAVDVVTAYDTFALRTLLERPGDKGNGRSADYTLEGKGGLSLPSHPAASAGWSYTTALLKVLWFLRQFRGLANALRYIHYTNVEGAEDGLDPPWDDETSGTNKLDPIKGSYTLLNGKLGRMVVDETHKIPKCYGCLACWAYGPCECFALPI